MSQALEKAEHNSLLNRDFPNQHPISAIEGLKEALEGKVPTERKVNGRSLDKDVEITEVKSAEKFKTARTVSLSGAVVSTPTALDGSKDIDIPVTKIYDSYLEWGGKNRAYQLSPLDASLLTELHANRLSFIPDSAVKFERSEDAGETWTDVSENFNGTELCTNSISFGNGNTVTNQSVNRKHRITIDCVSGNVYCMLAKIMIYITTNGATACKCAVEFGTTKENTVWVNDTTLTLSGYPGWNAINVHRLIGSENVAWSDSYRYVRLTFSISGVTAGSTSDFLIHKVKFISSILYDAPSVMARRGELFTYDAEQNATFPKNLTIQGNTLKIGNTTLTETQLKALLALLT